MSKLITTNVFIDTSIFCREGFNLTGHKLKAIHDLGEDSCIQIFITEIILRELEIHLNEYLDEIKLDKLYANLQRKIKSFESYLPENILNNIRLDQHLGIHHSFKVAFQKYLDDIHLIILSVSQVNVSKIFDAYFEKKPPFALGKKKSEFPDAFTLYALEDWCKQENEKMYVISADNDMESYCTESSNLFYLPDLPQFLDLINLERNSISEKVKSWFMTNNDFLLDKVYERLKERILDQSISLESISELVVSVLSAKLDQNIYSTDFLYIYVYAYSKVEVIFEVKGSCPSFYIQNQFITSWERKTDKYIDFKACWTVSCEIEVELKHQTQEEELVFSGVSVIGDINLRLEDADKLIGI